MADCAGRGASAIIVVGLAALGICQRSADQAVLDLQPVGNLASARDWIATGELWLHVEVTLTETVMGFGFGAVSGVAVGLALGLNRRLAAVLDPFIVAFYSLPKIALAPLFILWFGVGLTSKVVLATFVVFFLVFYNTYAGTLAVEAELVDVLRLMGARRGQIIRKVILPSALIWIFTGMKSSVPYASDRRGGGRDDGVEQGTRLSHRGGGRTVRYRWRVRGAVRADDHRHRTARAAEAERTADAAVEGGGTVKMSRLHIPPDLDMHYRVDDFTDPWRQPQTILMLHGNAESGLAWYAWVPKLARQYRVVRPDMRGFGNSTPMPRDYPWSLDRLTAGFLPSDGPSRHRALPPGRRQDRRHDRARLRCTPSRPRDDPDRGRYAAAVAHRCR